MIAVLQRVSEASVTVDHAVIAAIGRGWLILLGVVKGDDEGDVTYLCNKIINLRAFPDDAGKMNRSALDIAAEFLIVSQFTLAGDCRNGNRPSFTARESPGKAEQLYLSAAASLRNSGLKTLEGKFGADMKVSLVNDGPATFILDSRHR